MRRSVLMDFDPHLGMSAFEPSNHRGQKPFKVWRVAGNSDYTAAATSEILRHRAQARYVVEHTLCRFQEHRSRSGDTHATPCPFEERHPELALEVLHLLPE